MIEAAAFVILLQTFGGLQITVEAVRGIAACHQAYRVFAGQMTAGHLGFTVVRPCPPDPTAPVFQEPRDPPLGDAP